jgi:rhodanese-related sulfurtransferase
MNSQRVACKFFVHPDPRAPVELAPFIGVFHRFIQDGALDGLLLDVADYAHVPEGPGILLIGHDLDYGIDLAGGRAGLLTTRKRYGDLCLAEAVRGLFGSALRAIDSIERDGGVDLRFSTGEVTLQLIDRLAARNDEACYEAALAAIEPVLVDLYGEKYEACRAHADDPRRPLAITLTAQDAGPAAELAVRLVGERPVMAKQSDWDISVEDLKKLRDEGADFLLIDVREQHEYEICNLGGELVPLSQLAERIPDLDAGAHVVVHCRSGPRSSKAVEALRGAGFANAWNVNGGILAWIDRVDPSLTRY